MSKSELDVGALEEEVQHLRKRMAHMETKDMTLTFRREQERAEEMEEEKHGHLDKKAEANKEAEEEEQVNKLLSDLGLSLDIATNILHKPEERMRKMSQDQDTLISWENMEVNPLYAASTLSKTGQNLPFKISVCPEIRNPDLNPEPVNNNDSSTISSTGNNNNKDVEMLCEKELPIVNTPVTKSNNGDSVNDSSKDPFDFVEQYKSQLNIGTQKPSPSAKVLTNKSRSAASATHVQSSAIQTTLANGVNATNRGGRLNGVPVNNHNSDFEHNSSEEDDVDDSNQSANSNSSSLLTGNTGNVVKDTPPATLSSSPVF